MNILLFSPLSSIWANKSTEIALSRALRILGHRVHELNCDGELAPTCPSFTEAGLQHPEFESREVLRVCGICKSRKSVALRLSGNIGVNGLGSASAKAASLSSPEHNHTLSNDWQTWPLSLRESAYEILVDSKAAEVEVSREFAEKLNSAHYNRLRSYAVTREAIEQKGIEMLIVGDVFYSMNAGAWKAAEDLNIQRVTIGSALSFRKNGNALSLFRSVEAQALMNRSADWAKVKNFTLASSEIGEVRKNEKYSLSAKSPFTYSSPFRPTSPKKIRAKLGIKNSMPIVLVVTTTNDERFAARVSGKLTSLGGNRNFTSQISFLKAVIKTAGDCPGLNFVIRLHPRLLPNKRDSTTSPYLKVLSDIFEGAPGNVYLNSPSQEISLANVGLASQVVLNWTSTAGLDLLTLGVPVVSCEPNETFSYPPDIGIKLHNPRDLKQVIESAVKSGHDTKFAIAAFRYKNFISQHLALQISFAAPKRRRLSLFRILNWARLRNHILLPSLVYRTLDRVDGSRFRLSSNEFGRLEAFLNSDLQNLPPRHDEPPLSVEVERRLISKSVRSLRAGSTFSL